MGYKFSETEPNITEEANCRNNGFHCAENPLDCLTYYPDWKNSVYYVVNAAGDLNEDGTDSKISCTELTLIRKLSITDFVLESLEYMRRHPLREWNSHISEEKAEANTSEFAIARGKNPIVRGNLGTVLGMAWEKPESSQIKAIKVIVIDGKIHKPDTWYNILGEQVDFESEDGYEEI